jgi:TetR/AcrR family transcriptional regulator, transcriptional repressor for nem operon
LKTMTDRMTDILDAAEKRIRTSGYNGFSFREIAADVGIKSASVHHHFPTKSDLAAAVARRYRVRIANAVIDDERAGLSRVAAWKKLFSTALHEDGLMCLCGILAVEGDSLPEAVAQEARKFFEEGAKSIDAAASGRSGYQVLAQLEGALMLARSLADTSVFDKATANLTA